MGREKGLFLDRCKSLLCCYHNWCDAYSLGWPKERLSLKRNHVWSHISLTKQGWKLFCVWYQGLSFSIFKGEPVIRLLEGIKKTSLWKRVGQTTFFLYWWMYFYTDTLFYREAKNTSFHKQVIPTYKPIQF